MGQTICRDVVKNGNTTSSCHFEEWYFFKDMFSGGCVWSNVAYQYGCSNDDNDHLGLVMIHLVTFIMICIVYSRAYDLPLTDYTRCYVLAASIPMVIQSFSFFLAVLNANFHWYIDRYSFGDFMHYMKLVFPIVTEITLGFTTLIFLFWAMAVAVARKQFNQYLPVVHILALVGAMLLATADVTGFIGSPSTIRAVISINVLASCIIVAVLLIPIVALCCSSPKLGQSPLPIVSNAKHRALLAIPFAFAALSPAIIRIIIELNSRNIKGQKYRDTYLHVALLLHYLQPLFFAVAAISFLPQHRLCSKKSQKTSEIGEQHAAFSVNPVMTKEMYAGSPPPQPASLPAVLSGCYNGFGAQLTNPSMMPSPFTPTNFSPSCPPLPPYSNFAKQTVTTPATHNYYGELAAQLTYPPTNVAFYQTPSNCALSCPPLMTYPNDVPQVNGAPPMYPDLVHVTQSPVQQQLRPQPISMATYPHHHQADPQSGEDEAAYRNQLEYSLKGNAPNVKNI